MGAFGWILCAGRIWNLEVDNMAAVNISLTSLQILMMSTLFS